MRYEIILIISAILFIYFFNQKAIGNFSTVLITDQESQLSISGKLSLMSSSVSDLLLIPGVGDSLAQEIFEKKFLIYYHSKIDGMEKSLMLAKGIGKANSKKIAEYLR